MKKIRSEEKIPHEVLFEVFLKLSSLDIFRCYFVCKSWQSMISGPLFADALFKRIKSDDKKRILIENNIVYESCRYGSLERKQVSLPFSDKKNNPKFLSARDGIVLVGIGKNDNFLWDPSTGSYEIVHCGFTHDNDQDENSRYILYGLCCSVVIKIQQFRSTELKYDPTVTVYYRKSKRWRRINNFPYELVVNGQGAIRNGAPHWIVTRKDNEDEYVIIYYDMSDYKHDIKEVKTCLPCWLVKGAEFRFGVLKESLCLFNIKNRLDTEVWTMNENDMCWNKLVNVIQVTPSEFCLCKSSTKTDDQVCCQKKNKVRFEEVNRRRQNQCSDDDVGDELCLFDGPITDSVFNTVTYKPRL